MQDGSHEHLKKNVKQFILNFYIDDKTLKQCLRYIGLNQICY